jgi:serine/threonine protein kinase/lipopolysaccharide biosynthesis regulator YciM
MNPKKGWFASLFGRGNDGGKLHEGASPAVALRQSVGATSGDWHSGQTLLDDFVVERLLGEGGMGKVYLLKSRTTGTRFAVKRAKGLSEGERRNFLAELQTWIDLPEHANLVPCRFFRTVGDEVLIFAEYVEGGSLKDWIDSRKLYEGGAEKTLERILDTAVQFAWGLHCVHELGLVHQDVKPANVMMEQDAQVAVQGLKVRVTDYGLARARAAAGEQDAPKLGQSILVSSGGYTPAYCSPEQADGRKLDRRTDVWSWGVSVLEMFQGEVTWHSGRAAAQTLEGFREANGEAEDLPAMPEDMAKLLEACFRENPAQRWQSLEAVVQNLKGIYRAAVGTEYVRALGKIERRTTPQLGAGERRTREGASWTDPMEWLERALLAEGRDPAEATEIVARQANSRRGQLVADVAAYDEARRMYERLIKGGRKDLEIDLTLLCQDAASVHETAEDFSGALALYDRAIEIFERLVNVEGRRELANGLATLYINKANAVVGIGDNRAAVGLYDRAIEIRERLVNVDGRREIANDLAALYMNKANALGNLGDERAAAGLYDRAIGIVERLVNVEGRHELAKDLADLYSNKANAVGALGDKRAAVGLYDLAVEIFVRLVNIEGRRELANELAKLYMNKATAVGNLGDERAAVELYDRAIEIRERLVNVEGRRELANELATLYMNKATAVGNLGDERAAVELFDRAIEIRERLVNVEGRGELADGLARLYSNKAISVNNLGDERAAVGLHDLAIKILERLVNGEGRREMANDLATLYMNKAIAVNNLGENRAAVGLYDRAIEILERLVNAEGRHELANCLARLYSNKAIAVGDLGDSRAAVVLYDRAIEIRARLVNGEGRRELADDLAKLYMGKAVAVISFGDYRTAVGVYDKAIEIRERLVNIDGRREFAGDLACVKADRALVLILLGDALRGEREAREAMDVLRAEVSRTKRADLEAVLDRTSKCLGAMRAGDYR